MRHDHLALRPFNILYYKEYNRPPGPGPDKNTCARRSGVNA